VLIFSLQDSSSDIPLVSISEHTFGVTAVAWSNDSKFLASLGQPTDGFLYVWKVDPRTGAARLFQQNRCTSFIRAMIWMGNHLVTLGVRHVKVWKVEEPQGTSPTKSKFYGDAVFPPSPSQQKALPGRNILLGSLLDATFTCAVALDETRAILCSESGDVCLLTYSPKETKLVRVLGLGFAIACVCVREQSLYFCGTGGQFSVASIEAILRGPVEADVQTSRGSRRLAAMGFLSKNLVTIDEKRSIDIWPADFVPSEKDDDASRIPIPGHGDAVAGIQKLTDVCDTDASFLTWSTTGTVSLWHSDGRTKTSFTVPLEDAEAAPDSDSTNQLLIVKAAKGGKQFITGDKLGILRVMDEDSSSVEIKAHSSDCLDITLYEDDTRTLMASSGRDRTVQLFYKSASGNFEHFQTLEFTSRVVKVLIPSDSRIVTCSLDRTIQVYELAYKDDDANSMAAIQSRVISLRSSPLSIAMALDGSSVFASLLDRSVCHYDIETGRLLNSFKCVDEGGHEAAVLDSLVHARTASEDGSFLLAVSNTDKSVRMYDAQTGAFLDREWGHTEAINGVVLLDDDENGRKVVSVGSDGTIMIWALDVQETPVGSASRDASPEKGGFSATCRPPLRRVLSRAELTEFQRPSSTTSTNGRRSPLRTVSRRTSRYNLSTSIAGRPLVAAPQPSPSGTIAEDAPWRRLSTGDSQSGSPPESPNSKPRIVRRPSLPVLNSSPPPAAPARKKMSTSNLRSSYGFGSLSMATEQTSRQLRTYRKKLASSEPIEHDLLAELQSELRLTAAALGDRAIRTRASGEVKGLPKSVSETVISGILDQYSERLVSMLDEKLRLRLDDDKTSDIKISERPRTAGEDSTSSSVTLAGEP
jgi:WD40 repeat protein